MLKNMKIGSRLLTAFGGLFILTFLVNSALIFYIMTTLTGLTTNLFRHLFTVTKTVRDAHIKILDIRLIMKDIIFVTDQKQLEAEIENILAIEREARKDFALIQERYLGTPQDVKMVIETFEEWKRARDSVLANLRAGKAEDARRELNAGELNQRFLTMEQAMKVMTDFAHNKAESFAKHADVVSRQVLMVAIVVSIVMILIAMVIVFVVARSITKPLRAAVTIADHVSEGNLRVTFPAETHDEVGLLLRAMQRMTAYIQDVTNVADKISQQELSVTVQPKSSQDTLNLSMQRMIANLREMLTEIERSLKAVEEQNWVKDSVNQLSLDISGDLPLDQVCQKSLSLIARQIRAGHGVLYVYHADKEILTRGGAFAFDEQDLLTEQFRVGEGIIGQVARELQPITLTNVPRVRQRITTGTVSEPPVTVCAYPLLYDAKLYGVLEMANSEPLQPIHQTFLESASRVTATAIFSALQRERMQELLQQKALA